MSQHSYHPQYAIPQTNAYPLASSQHQPSDTGRGMPMSELNHHFSQLSVLPSENQAGPSRPYINNVLQPIPAPQPKAVYDPPVFRTFRDRKRAQGVVPSEPPILSPTYNQAIPSSPIGTQITNSQSRRSLPQPWISQGSPAEVSSAAMGMMGRPGLPIPPQPPARSSTTSSPNIVIEGSRPRSPMPQFEVQAIPQTALTSAPSSAAETLLERSDTVSSIRSLDRFGISSSKRPLPKTPVGVNTSKSLDRGVPSYSRIEQPRSSRRQPSTVEEDDEELSSASRSPILITPSISTIPSPVISSDSAANFVGSSDRTIGSSGKVAPQVIIAPTISIDSGDHFNPPAKFTPLPTFNFPEDDHEEEEEEQVTQKQPELAVSGVPIIAVTTDDSPERSAAPQGAIICATCQQVIIGRIVNAMNKRFHPQCFKCDECGELLEHVSSFEWDGRAYCHLDYHDKFAHQCFHCKTPIVDARFVTLNDAVLGERYYHELHFFCSECGDPFLDPSKSSAPGTETRQDDEEDETNPFVIHKGHPYCERCHIRLHKPRCKGCRLPIPDVAVRAMHANWHKECFLCTACGSPFANNLFFPKDDHALCTSCWGDGQ